MYTVQTCSMPSQASTPGWRRARLCLQGKLMCGGLILAAVDVRTGSQPAARMEHESAGGQTLKTQVLPLPQYPAPASTQEIPEDNLLEGWFSLTPEQQASIPAFEDDPSADFQFISAACSDTIRLVFCGMAQRFGGCPLPLIHCYLGRLGVHLLYLRDHDNLFYLNGKRRDHYDFVQTLERIRALSEQHGAKRILTIGTSSGGFGALHWGLELSAERIVSLAGPTNLQHILANLRERQAALGIPEPHRANK
jgi:hypothetical protein